MAQPIPARENVAIRTGEWLEFFEIWLDLQKQQRPKIYRLPSNQYGNLSARDGARKQVHVGVRALPTRMLLAHAILANASASLHGLY
jgi:hypothetical protein